MSLLERGDDCPREDEEDEEEEVGHQQGRRNCLRPVSLNEPLARQAGQIDR